MNILERLNIIDSFWQYIHDILAVNLKHYSIYIFGSILEIAKSPVDIDVLIIYDNYDKSEMERLEALICNFELFVNLPIDCTFLSKEEQYDTNFIERTKVYIHIV